MFTLAIGETIESSDTCITTVAFDVSFASTLSGSIANGAFRSLGIASTALAVGKAKETINATVTLVSSIVVFASTFSFIGTEVIGGSMLIATAS